MFSQCKTDSGKMNYSFSPRPRKQKVITCANIRNYFKQYCTSTSIHGFQYFGEDRSCYEKIWWVMVFCLCLSGCSFMIFKIWEKYETSPVIVTFATRETPVYQIPFPAVTICPETKSVKDKFDFKTLIKKKLSNENLTSTQNKYLQYMLPLCDAEPLLETKWDNATYYANDILEFLDEIKPDFFGNVYNCSFMAQKYDCKDLFVPVMTDEGVCYSFNILDRRHIFHDLVNHYKDYHVVEYDTFSWGMEKGYEDKHPGIYPRRALLAGATNGLTMNLATPKRDIDRRCKDVQGFKVILHSSVRIPSLKKEYFRIPLDQSVVAAVQPSMITTSESVKSFDVSKRECFFPSERKLMFFKSYSQVNCQFECLANLTETLCGCVNIFMPRTNNTNICGIQSVQCMKEAEEFTQAMEYSFHLYNESDSEEKSFLEDFQELFDCNCLPVCTDLSYNYQTSQTDWDWEERFQSMNPQTFNHTRIHLSHFTVFFKVNHFITSERQELYGPTDFVANFGGLLGLFTGFSILSLMEIIYFLTVRICCNVRLYGKWTGSTGTVQ